MAEKAKAPAIRFKGFTDDWEQRKFGEVAQIRRGLTYNPKNVCKDGVRVLRSSNINEDTFILKDDDVFVEPKAANIDFVKENDILITSANGSSRLVGKHALVKKPCMKAVHGGFMLLATAEEPEFTNSLMSSPWYDIFISVYVAGGNGAIGNLSKTDLEEQIVFVPIVSEQKRIGEYFNQLDNLIILHRRKFEKLQNVKKAMLEKMFPKNGNSVPEIRFAGFTDAWELRKVGELTNVASAARVHKEEWTSSGIPFFRSSDVVSAYKGAENQKAFISCELYEQLAKISGKLEKDDILITGGGSIGIPYIVPNNKPLYSKDADLIWVKRSEKFNSRFMYTYFSSPEFRRYLNGISHIGTIAHYTIEQVKETPICLPSIDEQNEIGSHFTHLDKLIALHQRKLEKLQNVKKACLEKMFV